MLVNVPRSISLAGLSDFVPAGSMYPVPENSVLAEAAEINYQDGLVNPTITYSGGPTENLMGLWGLGDCSMYPGTDYEELGVCYDDSGDVLGNDPDYITPAVINPITNTNLGPTAGDVPAAGCPQGVDLSTGLCVSTGAVYTPTVTSYPPGNTSAQNAALLAAITQAGSKVLTATAQPYLIPGTNSIYNPATGAITTAALTAGQTAAASVATTNALASSLMPIAMIGVAALVLMMMMGNRR